MSEMQEPTRRRFYVAVIYGLNTLIGLALGIPAAVYLLFPPAVKKSDEWTEAADLSKLLLQTPEEVVFRRNRKDGWKILSEKASAWVVRKSDKEVVAFAPQCTHLGCAYHWDAAQKNFLCPCHTSVFGLDGQVL